MIFPNCRGRHRRNGRFFGILNEALAAVLRDRSQPCGPVTVTTAQDNTDNPAPMSFGCGHEKRIGGWPCIVNLWPMG